MKILISESQLKHIILEQPDEKFGLERFGYNPNKPETMDKAVEMQRELNNSQFYRDALMLATSCIPVLGGLISAGVLGVDFSINYRNAKTDEEKKEVILSYIVSIAIAIGLGMVFKSIAKLGKVGMEALAKKIATRKVLLPEELQVVKDLSQHPDLVREKVKPFAESLKKNEPKGNPNQQKSIWTSPNREQELNLRLKLAQQKYSERYGKNALTKLESMLSSGKINEEQFNNWIEVGCKKIPFGKIPRKFYHGSKTQMTIDELNPFHRAEAFKEYDAWRVKSASSDPNNVGIYFSDNIIGKNFGYDYDRNITFRDYKKTKSGEPAFKYATWGNDYERDGYIYEMTLKPTANVVQDGTLGSNVVSIKTDKYSLLKSYKVDAVWNGSELNVLNKDAIESFKPIYRLDSKTNKWIKL